MSQKVIVDKTFLLKQISLFSELESYQLEIVAKKSDFFEYKKDEVIYKESDASDAFYLIISGRIRAFVTKPNGEIITLEHLHRGNYFGILSLLTNDPHSVSAQVINDSLILKINKEDFYYILKTFPQLAVHFSSILARRLKKRRLDQKTVFESTIISVYGAGKDVGSTLYALNLAKTLGRETKKDVIFLDMAHFGETDVSKFLEARDILTALELIPVFFDEVKVKNCIIKDESGINILRLPCGAQAKVDSPQIISLISYLATIFDYCVVDLPAGEDEIVLTVLGQSDKIHIVTDSRGENIEALNNLVVRLEGSLGDPQQKIKIIVSELNGRRENHALLKYKIYATLPDINRNEQEYNSAVRRVAREIGDVLIGIALGSGAAWGLSLIGVIKVLETEKIPVDIVVGSSMGALIGAFWAAGNTGLDMERIAIENKKRFGEFSFRDFKFPIRGLLSDMKTLYFLRRHLGNRTFQDIKFPLKVVAASLEDRREVIIDSGDLVDAVRASISIPGIYSPVRYKDTYLIDGGVLDPVPVSVLLKMNAKKIIAVNITPSPEDVRKGLLIAREKAAREAAEFKHKKFLSRIFIKVKNKILNFLKPNIMEIISNSIEALEYSAAEASCKQADVTIHPNIAGWSWKDFVNPEVLISLGEEACLKALPEIKRLIAED